MLDIKFIRENPEKIKTACQNRGLKIDVDKILKLDEKKRALIQKIEKLRQEKKKESRIEELKKQKEEIKKLEIELKKVEKDFKKLMYKIPNLPLDDVPVGKDESENVVIRKIGELPKGKFRDYLEIVKDKIDTERGAKVAGSRFYYLKNEAAILELKLINFAVEFLTKEKNIKKVIQEKN